MADSPPDQHSPKHIEEAGEASPHDERVAELIEHTIDVPVLAEAVEQQEAADAADTLENLPEEEAADVLEQMDDRAAAEALAEMQTPLAVGVVQDLIDEDLAYASRLLALMAPDDAADLLQAIEPSYREEILTAMPLSEAAALRRLISYDHESAGGMMTSDYLALRQDATVGEATEIIRGQVVPESVQHLPVIAHDGRLVGAVGFRDLLLSGPDRLIRDLKKDTVKAVRTGLDREAVAREFDRYDYAMLPVVDLDDRLIGIVTVDDVIDIIRAEQTEDVQKTVGAGAVEAVYSRLGEKLRGRFPWLSVSLLLSCFAAGVVLVFSNMISKYPTLAWLLPVIAAVVGNAGHQALAVTLRGIVLGEVRRERVLPLVTREATVGLLNGMAMAILIFLLLNLPFVPEASLRLAIVSAISVVIAMTVGTLSGACIPLVMRGLGIDPAQSSAIVLILITDGVSFTTLLFFAFWMLDRAAG